MKTPLEPSWAAAVPTAGRAGARGDLLARVARKAVLGRLARIAEGELRVVERGAVTRFGASGTGPSATLRVRDPRMWSHVLAAGSIGAGEAYVRGLWETDDLVALVRVFVRNRGVLQALEHGPARAAQGLFRLAHAARRNTERRARENIAAHYDLSNEFYALFLDPTLMYSAAVFEGEDEPLELASRRKLDLVCRKLDLRPGERLVEIGTGWGGLAIHAAREYGARVTTTTISRNQFELASARVREAGLQDRVGVVFDDYRRLTGTFDKLVSIEMIEAVGHQYLDEYVAACSRLLAPHGRMVLQSIAMREGLYAESLRQVDFIQRYIFPGSNLVSVAALAASVARASDLQIVHLEDLSSSYALTLKRWRERFLARVDDVRRLGFDDAFVRTWDYYLAYSEGGFREHAIASQQVVLTKPRGRPERAGALV